MLIEVYPQYFRDRSVSSSLVLTPHNRIKIKDCFTISSRRSKNGNLRSGFRTGISTSVIPLNVEERASFALKIELPGVHSGKCDRDGSSRGSHSRAPP